MSAFIKFGFVWVDMPRSTSSKAFMGNLIRHSRLADSHEFFEVLSSTERSQVAVMNLADGQVSGEFGTDHPQADQILIVLDGSGKLRVEEDSISLETGDVAIIPAGKRHQVFGPCRTLNVYAPVAYPDEA